MSLLKILLGYFLISKIHYESILFLEIIHFFPTWYPLKIYCNMNIFLKNDNANVEYD
jgi:hypothetical protein